MSRILIVVLAGAVLGLGAVSCGGTSYCNGTSCACPAGETCNFDACTGASCRLDCSANFTCTEAAGRLQRQLRRRELTVTVGEGSNVTCSGGACAVSCDGTCTVVDLGGAASITCKAGTKGLAGCE